MEEIEIIEKEIGSVIEIEERVPVWKMPSVMGKDFRLIIEYMKTSGIADTEVPYSYARYLEIDWESEMTRGIIANFIGIFTKKWHFLAGMPTPVQLSGTDNLKYRLLQSKKYIKAIHYGAYQKLGSTYKKMHAWSKDRGLKSKGESIEIYLNSPRTTSKESLKTMVLIPLDN